MWKAKKQIETTGRKNNANLPDLYFQALLVASITNA